ncbi:hypothetical protein D8674_022126 [Pyrus ussuriensis x Pyrus communis]|uniref:Uncharacterized protein n=1 Tax=Pyrus ussuriensis x Pyrus communis TaxID=2448454 RepID=A0A5N5GJM9_9ROSA|nr:hypothetical protein D8674_022126 [Pyrus ussuriensis x Pyrus communis]
MTRLCSHPRCESSGGDLKPRLSAVLPENGRKTRGLLEFQSQQSGMRFVISGGFDLDGVGWDDCAPCVHSENGRERVREKVREEREGREREKREK